MPSAVPLFRPKGWKPPDKNARSKGAKEWSKLYDYRWQKARKLYLMENPLCTMCREEGRYQEAEVVDHIIPHKGNQSLFWNQSNWQPLCKRHHDSDKQRQDIKRAKGMGGTKL